LLDRKGKINSGLKLRDFVGNLDSAAIFTYSGISANRIKEFRRVLRERGVKVKCAGNLVQAHALKNSPISKLYSEVRLKGSNVMLLFRGLQFSSFVKETRANRMSFVAGILGGTNIIKDEKVYNELSKFKSIDELIIGIFGSMISIVGYIAVFVDYCIEQREKGVEMLLEKIDELNLSEDLSGIVKDIMKLPIGKLLELKNAFSALGITYSAPSAGGASAAESEEESGPKKVATFGVTIKSTEGMKKLDVINWLKNNIESYRNTGSVAMLKEIQPNVVLNATFATKAEADDVSKQLKDLGLTTEVGEIKAEG
jgi:ribosomal protein L10/ribosomal protein L7/L12